jgi:hypothetical protein
MGVFAFMGFERVVKTYDFQETLRGGGIRTSSLLIVMGKAEGKTYNDDHCIIKNLYQIGKDQYDFIKT